MSTLRISNIEAKSVPASATIDEKVKITNSSGDPLVFIDGKTSGITTIGINTTSGNIKFDANSNVVVTGIITATKFVGTIEPTNLTVSGDLTIPDKIIHSGDINTTIRFPAADTITAETVGSERLRINSSGKVGLGTTGSEYSLSIREADNNNKFLMLQKNSGQELLQIREDGNNHIIFDGSHASGELHFYTAGTERARIDSSGYLIAKADIRLRRTASNNGALYFGDTNNNYIFGTDADDVITFATAGSERLRITSAGDVGIGTVSPQSGGLTVLRNLEARLQVWANGDGSNGKIALRADGVNTQIGTWSNHDCKLVRDSGIQASIISNGIQLPDGKSINFGNTISSAHQLDDYEEGSYTPVMGGSGWSYVRQTGFYRKVGTLVHVSIWITGSGGPNDSSTSTVSLPFTSHGAAEYRGGISGSWDSSNFDNTYTSGRNRSHLNNNTNMMQASFPFVDNGNWTSSGLVNTGLYNGFACQMSGSYIANA